MQRQDAVQLISDALRQFVPPGQEQITIDENTRLVGGNTILDSSALVSLIVEVEQQIDDRYGVAMTIADDRALSEQRSPFRTVGSLADYVVKVYEQTSGAARA